MSSIEPDFYVGKNEWKTARRLLKLAAALTPQMDEALTALIKGKTEVKECWGIGYQRCLKIGIYIDYPPLFLYHIRESEWISARAVLERAAALTPQMDKALTALIEGKAEVRVPDPDPVPGPRDDEIPF